MGFFPIIPNLPVAVTSTLDKTRKIFKFTRGIIRGWTLDPIDEERVRHSTEQDIMLTKLPLMVYVEKEGENMPQHMDLDPQIFGVAPRSVDWQIAHRSENWVKRFGLPLVPDFASTVHAATGDQFMELHPACRSQDYKTYHYSQGYVIDFGYGYLLIFQKKFLMVQIYTEFWHFLNSVATQKST